MRALLLSGGMDSTALAFMLKPEVAITVDYGQLPAAGEIQAATAIARELSIEHVVLDADCSAVGSGPLANKVQTKVAPVPEWWPYRNQLLVTLAAGYGVQRGVDEIIVGSIKTDGAHADGRQEFYELLSKLLENQEGNVRVSVPAIAMTAVELIRASQVPWDLLVLAHSCHISEIACGTCRGCEKYISTRSAAFAHA